MKKRCRTDTWTSRTVEWSLFVFPEYYTDFCGFCAQKYRIYVCFRHRWRSWHVAATYARWCFSHTVANILANVKIDIRGKFAKNDTIGQDNYWNKWGITNGNEWLRISYESLPMYYEAYEFAECIVNPLRMLIILTNTLANVANASVRLTNETTTQRMRGETPWQCFSVSLLFARLSWIVHIEPICFNRNGFASIRNVLSTFVWMNSTKSLRMS